MGDDVENGLLSPFTNPLLDSDDEGRYRRVVVSDVMTDYEFDELLKAIHRLQLYFVIERDGDG